MATSFIASRPWRLPSSIRHCSVHRTSTTQAAVRVTCNGEPASASTNTSGESGRDKHVDTRIHWGNSTEGWIGIEAGDGDSAQSKAWGRRAQSNRHYRYMGVSLNDKAEEIKFAYRRLSTHYHPDTTSLPLEIAAQKFMQLKDTYVTLSNDDLRNVYGGRLESKIASSNAGSLYGYPTSSQQGYDSPSQKRPERVDVDTLGGRNMPLGDQAVSVLAFDLFVLFICICVIVYVAFFQSVST